jgi:hypothetical protein
MALTSEQYALLQAKILADPVLSAKPANSDGAYDIAAAMNLAASPDFIVWKTAVDQETITQNGFDWVRVDNLSVGKARIWEWLFGNPTRSMNPSKANVRAGIDECWKGTAADLAVRAAVYVHCKRNATRAEKLFASGVGTDATPATMSFEGQLWYQDVMTAMGW